ncbi:antitoxin [Serinibacter salmoneus]|uniref:Antitoxin n=1 Tax=Serinibacter salmoneus TaxID=556530 RepID=A0A2A9CY13_9MICO|nr:antitoxin [Serinibacter salmoneus]PFG19026.1 hypothetical protein ATL40_0580 [Serinibacter salmoneus]
MRTTVTLEPEAEILIRQVMRERGLSFKDAINQAILDGLRPARAAGHVTPTHDLGGARVPLDRALSVAADLEDDELLRRREVGK